MEETFSSTIVMSTPENFMKNMALHKAQLYFTKMTSGLPRLTQNGFLKRMLKWKITYRKNLEEVELLHKSNS